MVLEERDAEIRMCWPSTSSVGVRRCTARPAACRPAVERDDLAQARAALARTNLNMYPGQWFVGTVAAAAGAGEHESALAAFEQAGAVLEGALQTENRGVLPWRSSAATAARLGRIDGARGLIAPELDRAQELRISRLAGIALRVAGFVENAPELLERSVDVLERSAARLQLGYSLLFLSSAHRRARRARDAREPLQRALRWPRSAARSRSLAGPATNCERPGLARSAGRVH